MTVFFFLNPRAFNDPVFFKVINVQYPCPGSEFKLQSKKKNLSSNRSVEDILKKRFKRSNSRQIDRTILSCYQLMLSAILFLFFLEAKSLFPHLAKLKLELVFY